MKFMVKTINSNRYEFEVGEDETVESLKQKLQEKTNIDPARQKLIFLGKVLQNQKKLAEYNVDGKVLHLVESAAGSGGPSAGGSAPPPRTNSTTTSSTQHTVNQEATREANRMMDQIMSSLGVDVNQASVTRHNLGNGSVALNMSVASGTNEEVDIQIINSTTTQEVPTTTATGGAQQQQSTTSTTSTSSTTNTSQPGGSTGRRGPPPNLERVVGHLRSIRDLMQHINCTAPAAQDVVSSVLMQPCIRGQHTAGPSVEQGATQEEVQQRANSRETIEAYAHIMIDMADIMQELVRYMNQYAKLLHRDPPLTGGDLVHCQNLVDRLGMVFHEISHAFHSLSDYSITLDSPLPRRLWMAQIAGAHQIVVEARDANGQPQQMRQELNMLQQQLRNLGGGGAARMTGNFGANTPQFRIGPEGQRLGFGRGTTRAPGGPGAAPGSGAPSAPGAPSVVGFGRARAAPPSSQPQQPGRGPAAAAPPSSQQTGATPNQPQPGTIPNQAQSGANQPQQPGNNEWGTQYSVSLEMPVMSLGRGGPIGGVGQPNIRVQTTRGGMPGRGPNGNMTPSTSLICHSRHSIPFNARCPVHQQGGNNAAPQHGHVHSHGRTRHAHSHNRQPRPPTTGGATTGGPQPPTRPPPTAPMMGRMQQMVATLMGDQDPERAGRFTALMERMMRQPDQPIASFLPQMREMWASDIEIPDPSRVSEMMEIVGSRYTAMELLNALQNTAMYGTLLFVLVISIYIQSDPDLPGCSGERVFLGKSGCPVYRGKILFKSYIRGNLSFRVTRHNLGNGSVALNMSVASGTNEEVDIQIINSTTTQEVPTTTATGGAQQQSTTSTTSTSSTTNPSQPGGSTGRRGPPPNLERVVGHLRSIRDLMQHINCTTPAAQDVVSSVLMQPCIRGQHTAGPSVEQGATAEEVQQRANSRETIEAYAHIMIDMADIMQELVRYMNQYAKLLHRDPPLTGGDLVHCQNLVDRLGMVFHEISHAFHSLSDYSITLDSPLPRRLWMAQIAGAHQIVVEARDANGQPQQMRQELNMLQQQLRNLGGGGAARMTGNFGANTPQFRIGPEGQRLGFGRGTARAPGGPGAAPGSGAPSAAPGAPSVVGFGRARATPPSSQPQQPGRGPAAAAPPSSQQTGATPNQPQPGTIPNQAQSGANQPQQPGNNEWGTQMQQMVATLMGDQDPERAGRFTALMERMMRQPDQPIASFLPQMREMWASDIEIPDPSRVSEMMEIVGSRYTAMELLNALQNTAMFDIIYQPLRSHFTAAIFNHAAPSDREIEDVVEGITTRERELILAAFDYRPTASGNIDEGATIIVMVREFLCSVFRSLYNTTRGDIAAGFGGEFGRALMRLMSLSMALNREVTDPNSDQGRMMGSVMQAMRYILPIQNIPSSELNTRYIVRRSSQPTAPPPTTEEGETTPTAPQDDPEETTQDPEEEEEEEFVDAEDGGPPPLADSSMESEEAMEVVTNGDDLPDDVIPRNTEVPRNTAAPEVPRNTSRTTAAPVARDSVVRGAAATAPKTTPIPEEWKAVLEKDAQVIRSTKYGDLSDGYVGSLPAKRRRTTKRSSDKPEEILEELLSASGAGTSSATPDPELQAMFRDRLKEDLRRKIRDHKGDIDEGKFPAASALERDEKNPILYIPPGPKKRGVRRASYLPNRNFYRSDILTQVLYTYSFEESGVSIP
eukprot:sb/3460727/